MGDGSNWDGDDNVTGLPRTGRMVDDSMAQGGRVRVKVPSVAADAIAAIKVHLERQAPPLPENTVARFTMHGELANGVVREYVYAAVYREGFWYTSAQTTSAPSNLVGKRMNHKVMLELLTTRVASSTFRLVSFEIATDFERLI